MDPRDIPAEIGFVLSSMRREAETRVAAAYKRLDDTRAGRTESCGAREAWDFAEAYRQAVLTFERNLLARLHELEAA